MKKISYICFIIKWNMKFFLVTSDEMQTLRDKVNQFLDEHPGIILHSHQFATCGTTGKNKYVSIFYDDAPEYLKIKNNDKGTERTL
jgi:hypothetical protein